MHQIPGGRPLWSRREVLWWTLGGACGLVFVVIGKWGEPFLGVLWSAIWLVLIGGAAWLAATARRRRRVFDGPTGRRRRALYPVKPIGWLIASWVLCLPIGIYSLAAHWTRIDAAVRAGDPETAWRHADRVRVLGRISMIAAALLTLLLLAAIVSFSTKPCGPDGAGGLIDC